MTSLLGIVGAGHIAACLVTGWRRGPDGPAEILLSPRNAAVAARLADRLPGVAVATDNQSVLDRCDTVILAMRPQDAVAALAPLRFRANHLVISLIAAHGLDRLAPLVAPARAIVRAVPMPFAADRIGPIALHPPHPAVVRLFAPLGEVVAVSDASSYDRLSAATATMSMYFRLLGGMSQWLETGGVPADLARRYVASQFAALGRVTGADPAPDFEALVHAFATPGGINEQLRRQLEDAGIFEAVAAALDRILRRIEG